MTSFPKTITFLTDKNEAILQGIVADKKKDGSPQAEYKYSKSKTKKGVLFTVSLDYLNRLADGKLLKAAD